MQNFLELRTAIVAGDAAGAVAQVRALLDDEVAPVDIMNDAVTPAMAEIGRQFESGECFVPELLMAARATKEIFNLIRPLLTQTNVKPRARVVLGTVRGDLHDIGKNLVAAMLEGGGFEVTDVGVDAAPEKFIAAIKEKRADIVGLSALLTSTLPAMKAVIEALQVAGIRNQIKVMIGGAPVTQNFADSIGADGYCANATASVELAHRLAGVQR